MQLTDQDATIAGPLGEAADTHGHFLILASSKGSKTTGSTARTPRPPPQQAIRDQPKIYSIFGHDTGPTAGVETPKPRRTPSRLGSLASR